MNFPKTSQNGTQGDPKVDPEIDLKWRPKRVPKSINNGPKSIQNGTKKGPGKVPKSIQKWNKKGS